MAVGSETTVALAVPVDVGNPGSAVVIVGVPAAVAVGATVIVADGLPVAVTSGAVIVAITGGVASSPGRPQVMIHPRDVRYSKWVEQSPMCLKTWISLVSVRK